MICPALSFTMKQASLSCSTHQGGGKRRSGIIVFRRRFGASSLRSASSQQSATSLGHQSPHSVSRPLLFTNSNERSMTKLYSVISGRGRDRMQHIQVLFSRRKPAAKRVSYFYIIISFRFKRDNILIMIIVIIRKAFEVGQITIGLSSVLFIHGVAC